MNSIWDRIVNDLFDTVGIWEWKFAWLPKQCHITNKRIWLHYAYRGRIFMGDSEKPFQVEERWRTTEAHILELLKK